MMSDSAGISAFNAAVDASRFSRQRDAELGDRISVLERMVWLLSRRTLTIDEEVELRRFSPAKDEETK